MDKNSIPIKKTKKGLLGKLLSMRVLVFVGVFAIVGVAYQLYSQAAYSGHHAKCLKFDTPTTVYAGEEFTANVEMKNDGSSTWSAGFGVYLGERYVNEGRWQYQSGYTLSGSYSPNSVAKFPKLKILATKTVGQYYLSPEMQIVLQGPIPWPCARKLITVKNRPDIEKPKISITSPASGATLKGSVTISASASDNKGVSKVVFAIDGKNAFTDSSSPYKITWNSNSVGNGSHTIKATAYDTAGNNASAQISVKVSNTTTTSGGTSGGGSTSGSGGTTGSNRSVAQADKTPPSAPESFVATANNVNKSINLSWGAATDNVGVAAYQLERSSDGRKNWEILSSTITGNEYEDFFVDFGTQYDYRVKAIDAANNSSKYAEAKVTTSDFEANARPGEDAIISTADESLSILIPSGALETEAFCDILNATDTLPPDVEGYVYVSGPYQFTCRDKENTTITSYNQALVLTAQTGQFNTEGVTEVAYFALNEDGSWNQLAVTSRDDSSKTDTVELGNNTVFSVMGSQKKTSLLFVIFMILLIIGGLLLLTRLVVMFIVRRRAQAKYDDYVHKSRGY